MSGSLFLLLAFGFTAPWMMAGMALAAIPVLIHLLHRRRYVEVPWAAMRFLLEATRKQSRRMRLENFILLAVRTLLLALLVLALAGPGFDDHRSVIRSAQPTHRILVLDTSFSMQCRESEAAEAPVSGSDETRQEAGTRLDRAKQAARNIIEQAQRGDAWQLVRITGAEPFVVIGEPSFRPETVLEELNAVTVTDSPGDLPGVLANVSELLTQMPRMPRKEVVFLTDLQASLWAPDDEVQQKSLAATMRKLAQSARIVLVNAAGSGAVNAAVTSLNSEGTATLDRPLALRSTIHNFHSTALREQTVELLVDGRLEDTRRIDLPPASDLVIDWSVTFRSPGDHRLEVRLPDDSLKIDNHRWLTVSVRDETRVLIVDGRTSGRRFESASFYVAQALAPQTAEDASPGSLRPLVISDSELGATALSRFDAVILCNVGLLTDHEGALLDAYVRSGGGLIIFAGDQVNPDSYNQVLYRDGEGLLPARMGSRVQTSDREAGFGFDPHDFAHPLLRVFQGNPGAGLEATQTLTFFKLEPAVDAATALWFSDGSPAIVERRAGAGRVILAATAADDRWGTWAIWAPGFVPAMHECVQFVVADRARDRQKLVDEPIADQWPGQLFDMPVSLKQPNGETNPLPLQEREGLISAMFPRAERAGIYEVQCGAPLNRSDLFAVNVDTRESDLAPVDQQLLQSTLLPDVDVSLRSADDVVPQSTGQEYDSGQSRLSRGFAWSVLVLLLIEPLLAWRFRAGAAALIVACLTGLMMPVLGLILSLIVAGAMTAAVIVVRFRGNGSRS